MKISRILIAASIFALALGSCEKEKQPTRPMDYNNPYFPLKVGNSISYQIEEINIDEESGVNDTVSYQIRELIESITEKTDEYTSYRLERHYREDASKTWEMSNVWQIRKYNRRIHKIEENIDYVRLVTPIEEGMEWDGNTFNLLGKQMYRAKSIKDSLVLGESRSVLTVAQASKESLIDKIFEEEQYAKNIGLIQKQNIDVKLNINPNKPWYQNVIKGTIFRQTIIDTAK